MSGLSVDRLVGRLERAAHEMKTVEREGVNSAARAVAAAAMVELAADTGGTLGLRGIPKAKLAVEVKASTGSSNFAAFVRGVPAGIWHILAGGAKPHIVGSGRGRTGIAQSIKTGRTFSVTAKGGRSFQRKLLRIGDNVVTGPFVAGGSPAKHTFARAVDKVDPLIPKIVDAEVQKVLRGTFRDG